MSIDLSVKLNLFQSNRPSLFNCSERICYPSREKFKILTFVKINKLVMKRSQ